MLPSADGKQAALPSQFSNLEELQKQPAHQPWEPGEGGELHGTAQNRIRKRDRALNSAGRKYSNTDLRVTMVFLRGQAERRCGGCAG